MAVTDESVRMRMISIMIAGCPASASSVTDFTVDAYLIAIEGVATDILKEACLSYLRPPARQYAPSASELAARCHAMTPRISDPSDVTDMRNMGKTLISVPIGQPIPDGYEPVSINADYGYGRIDMRRMTREEVERVDRDPYLRKVLANKPRPELILRDPTRLIAGSVPQPKLQRMG